MGAITFGLGASIVGFLELSLCIFPTLVRAGKYDGAGGIGFHSGGRRFGVDWACGRPKRELLSELKLVGIVQLFARVA